MWELSRIVFPSDASSRISVAEFDARPRIEVRGRFVENQHIGIVDDRAAQRDALFEPLREALDVPVAQIADAHEVDDVGHRLPPGLAPEVVPSRKEVQVLFDGRVRVDAGVVGHEARDPSHLLGVIDDGVSADPRIAFLRRVQRRQDAHRRRLARAVGADEPEHLAAVHAERHVIDGTHAAEVADEPVDLQHRAHGRPSGAPEHDVDAAALEHARPCPVPRTATAPAPRDTSPPADARRAAETWTAAATSAGAASVGADHRHRLLAAGRQRTAKPVERVAVAIAQHHDRRVQPVGHRHPPVASAEGEALSRRPEGNLFEVRRRTRRENALREGLCLGQVEGHPLAAALAIGAERQHGDVSREAKTRRRRQAGAYRDTRGPRARPASATWSSIVKVIARPCTRNPSSASA